MQIKQKLTEEKASMAVYVTIVLLSFLIILTGIYMVSASVRKAQLKTAIKIKQSYELDNPYVEVIYQNQLSKTKYVSDNLIVHYDAINNTGNGHDSTATTWKNLAGTSNNGIINGGAIIGDNCVKFDGVDDWVNIGEINDKSEITLEATIKRNSNQTGEKFILCNYSSAGMAFNINNGNIDMLIKTTDGAVRFNTFEGAEMNVGKIYHTALTYDGKSMRIYLNGKCINNKSCTGAIMNPINPTVMAIATNPEGTEPDSTGNHTNMDVYSVRIYEKALTDQQIVQNYRIDKNKYGF